MLVFLIFNENLFSVEIFTSAEGGLRLASCIRLGLKGNQGWKLECTLLKRFSFPEDLRGIRK